MTYPTVNGVPLDQIFDLYISGTKAALTGYTVKIAGVATDLRDLLAPLYLGSSAAPTKFKVNNADLNTIFAAHGTAHYGLPIDGNSYEATVHNVGTTNAAQLQFSTNNSTWAVNDLYGGVLDSGSIPSGATSVLYSYTVTSGTPTSVGNGASTRTSLTASNLNFTDSTSNTGAGAPGKGSVIRLTISYANSGGTVISTTNISFDVTVPPIP